MRLRGLIRELRLMINDAEGLGYSEDFLIEVINDGLCLIYQLRPEAFAVSRLLPAQLGGVQCINDCCDRLISVDGITDDCGNPIAHIRQGSVKTSRSFDKSAIGGSGYVFSLRDGVSNQFEVAPAIAKQGQFSFRITCTSKPAALQGLDDEVPDCTHHEALLNYALYRLYAVETDSAVSQQLSARYYNQMMQLLGIERALAQEILEDNHATSPSTRYYAPERR